MDNIEEWDSEKFSAFSNPLYVTMCKLKSQNLNAGLLDNFYRLPSSQMQNHPVMQAKPTENQK